MMAIEKRVTSLALGWERVATVRRPEQARPVMALSQPEQPAWAVPWPEQARPEQVRPKAAQQKQAAREVARRRLCSDSPARRQQAWCPASTG
jgi:hypothetical protein